MKIGIDARFFGPRSKGLGRYTQELIKNLEKIDRQNDYVIFLRQDEFDEYEPQNPLFKKVLAPYRWYSLAEQIFMPLAIAREKVDLMHFPHFNVPIFYRGRFVVTIHDLILQYFSNRRNSLWLKLKYWIKNAAYHLIIRSALWRAQKIIAVSNYVKEDIIKCFRIEAGKIAITYEGAPAQAMTSSPKTDPYILYVGNAYPHKNLERLIRAFEILIKKINDLKLVLVGWDEYFYPFLKKSVPETKRIVFAGFVNDEELAKFYNDASLYVFPSLCEGFGLPPLEAMARGVPVVSSSATCLPEILGQAALYFDPGDENDMAQKIKCVLADENLQRDLVKKGFEQIKRYSWEKMARETLEIYKGI